MQELDNIKYEMKALNQKVGSQCYRCCCSQSSGKGEERRSVQNEERGNDRRTSNKKSPGRLTKDELKDAHKTKALIPVRDVSSAGTWGKENTISFNPFAKQKPFVSRHHLDDSAVR
jgi:hypothetical protein